MVPLNYHLGKTPGADSNDSKLEIKPDTKSGWVCVISMRIVILKPHNPFIKSH